MALINQRSVNVELRKILDEQTEKLKQLQALVRETQTSPAAVNNQGLTSVQQVLDGLHAQRRHRLPEFPAGRLDIGHLQIDDRALDD